MVVAPDGTSNAVVRMVTTSLRGQMYVDDVVFGNLLANAGFELDANNDTRPDNWSSNPNVDRSDSIRHGGAYAMRHASTTPVSYAVTQTVSNITPGVLYTIVGWTNIPASSGMFTSFRLEVEWRNGSTVVGTPAVIKSYTAATNGWERFKLQPIAPAGANTAVLRLVAQDLSRTIYLDDFYMFP